MCTDFDENREESFIDPLPYQLNDISKDVAVWEFVDHRVASLADLWLD